MIHYDDYNLQLIERATRQYNNQGDYWRAKGLLEVRKRAAQAALFMTRSSKNIRIFA